MQAKRVLKVSKRSRWFECFHTQSAYIYFSFYNYLLRGLVRFFNHVWFYNDDPIARMMGGSEQVSIISN